MSIKKRGRWWLWPVGTLLAFVLGGGVGSVVTLNTLTTASDKQTPGNREADSIPRENGQERPEFVEPEGSQVSGYCDHLPGDEDQRAIFAAALDTVNEGNIGVVIEVWAEFPQTGGKPLRLSEEVEVPAGETVSVYLHSDASTEQTDRFKSSDAECEIGSDIVKPG